MCLASLDLTRAKSKIGGVYPTLQPLAPTLRLSDPHEPHAPNSRLNAIQVLSIVVRSLGFVG